MDEKTTIRPWHFVAGTAMSFIPIIGEPGDTVVEMRKIKEFEKTPVKDTFIKAIENKGKKLRESSLFKDMFKEFPSKKLGKTWFAFWTIIDIAIFTELAKVLSVYFSKSKN